MPKTDRTVPQTGTCALWTECHSCSALQVQVQALICEHGDLECTEQNNSENTGENNVQHLSKSNQCNKL